MINNPIIQSLILIGFGFLLGIVTILFWLLHQTGSILTDLWRSLSIASLKFRKENDINIHDIWTQTSKIINKTFEETSDEERHHKFKDEINNK